MGTGCFGDIVTALEQVVNGQECRPVSYTHLADPIPGDPERLKQVLCNVLDNAAKHGGSGCLLYTSRCV